jgi:hypothetical protein
MSPSDPPGKGGGRGGGRRFLPRKRSNLQRLIREAELEVAGKEFSPQLAERLNALVAHIDGRQRMRAGTRFQAIQTALADQLETTIELWFGGFVASHVSASGLSDADLLLVLKEPTEAPRAVLAKLEAQLRQALPRDIEVTKGAIGITLADPTGGDLTVVPAMRTTKILQVPSQAEDRWARLDLEAFCEQLVERNEACAMRLVPTIKLGKAIAVELPRLEQLLGYHIETMALTAFDSYRDPKTLDRMLPHFFRTMSQLVLSPIRDADGRSMHVDDYLGRANGEERKELSRALDRVARRMDNATAARSLEQWNTIIEWTAQVRQDG